MEKKSQISNPQSQIKLKVCGLTKLSQIQELIYLNVDFLGFIFYEKSARFVLNHLSFDEIKSINHKGKVGVFVNESIEKIIEIAERGGLNYIQLHGDEDKNFILSLRQKLNENIKIIKVFRVGTQNLKLETWNLKPIDYFLFDTDSQSFGGTGHTFDWNILNNLEIPKPYFLSGGISLENIDELLNFVKVNLHENKTLTKLNPQKPLALDINSKFEIEAGVKDLEKIRLLMDKI